ncbi:ATP-binding protein [Nonomuraea sp. 10N515B]|uniref:ATP-binding protein n=1 Tax=Nonomuraea sp. 10N515B TaxID=3457422 RepID=UPI003FCE6E15
MSGRFLAELVFPGVPSSVPAVRHCVKDVLVAAGHRDASGAQLLVSELVANAISHSASGLSGGLVTVDIWAIDDHVARIDVIDNGGPIISRMHEPDETDCSGRGLWIVDETALCWGIGDDAMGGRMIWAEVLTSDDEPAGVPVLSDCAVGAR